jgi:hypothetical protein
LRACRAKVHFFRKKDAAGGKPSSTGAYTTSRVRVRQASLTASFTPSMLKCGTPASRRF